MQLSINQLSDLTGKDRRTITRALSDLAYVDGAKGAYLYESAEALELVYGSNAAGRTLDEAKKEQAFEAAALSKARREEIQKTRIPHDVVEHVDDITFQSIAASLKAAQGKVLTAELINELFARFRDMPLARTARADG